MEKTFIKSEKISKVNIEFTIEELISLRLKVSQVMGEVKDVTNTHQGSIDLCVFATNIIGDSIPTTESPTLFIPFEPIKEKEYFDWEN